MRFIRQSLVLAAVVAAAACAATKAGKAQDIKFSGFLSTYSGLEATNDSDKSAFRYAKPGLDLNGYGQILLDKPEARMSPEEAAHAFPDDGRHPTSQILAPDRGGKGGREGDARRPYRHAQVASICRVHWRGLAGRRLHESRCRSGRA